MRLRLGRPDIGRFSDLFDVPAAGAGLSPTSPSPTNLSVTFMGVSTLLIDDGTTAVMTDGFFSRPGLLKVGLGRLAPDLVRIDDALTRCAPSDVKAVIPVHSHFDHALDAAVVAERTGAMLIGGESTANVGRGHGLAAEDIRVVTPGATLSRGAFTLAFFDSAHCPPDRYPGEITEPLVPPARTRAWKCGEAWSVLITHASGKNLLVQGSAGYVPGALAGQQADVVYLGIGQLGVQTEDYIGSYWAEIVEAVGAKVVVLTHWDDFFRGLDQPLRALPYAGDDLDVTMRLLGQLAAEQGVSLHFPTVWQREDPWALMR
jgi:L-ascorbate metabolism protein UlaG (beta-lactamase superfamily)